MHCVRGVGGADIDMHQHALAATADQGVTTGHVSRSVLVGTANRVRYRLAALAAVGQFLDDRRMVGTEIAE